MKHEPQVIWPLDMGTTFADTQNVSLLRVPTSIDVSYGLTTWRLSQSVVDILQNHLDANTRIFEIARLRAVGASDQDPSTPHAQEILSSISRLLSAHDQEARLQEVGRLLAAVGSSAIHSDSSGTTKEPCSDLIRRLQAIRYVWPDLQLELSDGVESMLVGYHQVVYAEPSWQVVGFRVTDGGTGFDYRLLNLMGGTTKANSESSRGGLGEGLKMSVTQLHRMSAKVRISSRNVDNTWWLEPSDENGLIEFVGEILRRDQAPSVPDTGSSTFVDFSKADFSSVDWELIRSMLDLREDDEGLAKYILGYGFDAYLTQSSGNRLILPPTEPGRVYVRGLLIEEGRSDLLWSYNLADKWAISGRDRKTIHAQHLDTAIGDLITQLEDPDAIAHIVEHLQQEETFREVLSIATILNLTDRQKEIWRQAFTEILQYTPGTSLFCTRIDTPEDQRIAIERGKTLIRVPYRATRSLSILKLMYEPSLIYLLDDFIDDLQDTDETAMQDPILHTVLKDALLTLTNQVVDPDTAELLRGTAITFDGWNEALNDKRPSTFPYPTDKSRDVISVETASLASPFARDADLLLAVAMVLDKSKTTTTVTDPVQDRLGRTLTMTILRHHPELLTFPLPASVAERKEYDTSGIGYDPDLAKLDIFHSALWNISRLLRDPSGLIDIDLLEQRLTEAKDLREELDDDSFEPLISRFLDDDEFVYNGAVMEISHNLDIHEYTFEQDDHIIVVNSPFTTIHRHGIVLYTMLSLQIGEQIICHFTQGNHTGEVLISRTPHGYHFSGHRNYSISRLRYREIIFYKHLNAESSYFWLRGNLLYAYQLDSLHISYPPSSHRASLSEVHRSVALISSDTTLDYGHKVWNNPKRILIDAIQNHQDADPSVPPIITYQVRDYHGTVRNANEQEVAALSPNWEIVGISIEDRGPGYPTPYLTRLGASTKSDADAGKFGEGLKMLAASATLLGIPLELRSRDWIATPTAIQREATTYENRQTKQFDVLGYHLQWLDTSRVGSKTSFSILNIPEIDTRQRVEGGSDGKERQTVWQDWVEVIDPRKVDSHGHRGLDRYILPKQSERFFNHCISVLLDRPGQIFEKGLYVPVDTDDRFNDRPLMFGYNLHESSVDTRERNVIDLELLDRRQRDYFSDAPHPEVIRELLARAKMDPGTDYYEYRNLSIDDYDFLWRQVYYEIFGSEAILSLEAVNKGTEQSKNRFVHLERYNTVQLHPSLTEVLKATVYTSDDFFSTSGKTRRIHINVTPAEQSQIYNYAIYINRIFIDYLTDMMEDRDMLEYLENGLLTDNSGKEAIRAELNFRLEQLAKMRPENILIGALSNSNEGACLSELFGLKKNIELRQDLFLSHVAVIEVYLHELIHYVTDKDDFEIIFARWFSALTLHADLQLRKLPPYTVICLQAIPHIVVRHQDYPLKPLFRTLTALKIHTNVALDHIHLYRRAVSMAVIPILIVLSTVHLWILVIAIGCNGINNLARHIYEKHFNMYTKS